ncbi:hypothetical protein [Bradyrhizobium sp. PRIMUS42]|uniref:hypothetical protein n=1 Tax=Bradyrhizobium sp. PRIMUS42 TaxID=2908926 RepID=UPI001FF11D4B|nr:hypothetical protein [Bradyrhizobium sp. PRIMUS42]MCJ9731291.1 hypothetical protein [Bradyrhizobium sp. PRIMUS42]
MSTRDIFIRKFDSLNQERIPSRRISAIGKAAFDIRDAAAAAASTAAGNPHLNEAGQRNAKQAALRDPLAEIARSKAELRRIAEQARAELKALALPPIEKGDVIAEMREAEMRAIVRAMPQEKRDTLSKLSPGMVAAIVRAAPEVSGISRSVHEQLHSELIETAHPEKVAAVRAEIEGLQFAELAVKETDKALTEAADFAPGEEYAFRAQIDAEIAKPPQPTKPDPNDLDAIISEHRRRHGIRAE